MRRREKRIYLDKCRRRSRSRFSVRAGTYFQHVAPSSSLAGLTKKSSTGRNATFGQPTRGALSVAPLVRLKRDLAAVLKTGRGLHLCSRHRSRTYNSHFFFLSSKGILFLLAATMAVVLMMALLSSLSLSSSSCC